MCPEEVARPQGVPLLADTVGLRGVRRDLLLERVREPPVRRAHAGRALEEVERAVVASIAGEYADVHGGADPEPPTRDRALAIGAAKTAAYSVVLPLVLGAVLAGAPMATRRPPPSRAMRSAMRSACSGWWVDSNTAMPCWHSWSMCSSTRIWLPKSRLAGGSSITSSTGSCVSARAISTSWRSPPLMAG